ncbi:hypothetical protein PMAYCL1PPCAC_00611, partial [Pristionchus mayeri]
RIKPFIVLLRINMEIHTHYIHWNHNFYLSKINNMHLYTHLCYFLAAFSGEINCYGFSSLAFFNSKRLGVFTLGAGRRSDGSLVVVEIRAARVSVLDILLLLRHRVLVVLGVVHLDVLGLLRRIFVVCHGCE